MTSPPSTPLRSLLYELIEDMQDRSQAGYVLLGAAALDEALERELLLRMKPLKNEMRKRIFGGYGPLANFAAKIDLCLVLNIITDKTYADLRNFNKIRVKFAHSSEPIRLQDKEIIKLLTSIVGTIPDEKNFNRILVTALDVIKNDLEAHRKAVENGTPPSSSWYLLNPGRKGPARAGFAG